MKEYIFSENQSSVHPLTSSLDSVGNLPNLIISPPLSPEVRRKMSYANSELPKAMRMLEAEIGNQILQRKTA